jgi:hypothetical protein
LEINCGWNEVKSFEFNKFVKCLIQPSWYVLSARFKPFCYICKLIVKRNYKSVISSHVHFYPNHVFVVKFNIQHIYWTISEYFYFDYNWRKIIEVLQNVAICDIIHPYFSLKFRQLCVCEVWLRPKKHLMI